MASLEDYEVNNAMPDARPRTSDSYKQYPAAVWGRDLIKSYGKLRVLNKLSVNVPRGSIYGLLGPSGCGKTTLLRCVLGRLHLDSGHLIVLGDRPGARGHKVPGSMVGYMPQETGLFPDLTIAETLKYFGTLHGMTSEHIRNRRDFLIEFLTLPERSRLICQLSGGQMRRVSFAVALLHEPELLILDEPTVGVDPVLRERIWDHLINITSHTQNQVTIILTTHYVEEARQADKVGFMRNGKILAEEEPQKAMEKYHMTTLENVFLKLCQEDTEGTPADITVHNEQIKAVDVTHTHDGHLPQTVNYSSSANVVTRDDDDDVPLLDSSTVMEPVYTHSKFSLPIGLPSCRNILAQFIKNLTIYKRKIGFLLFQFFLPLVEIVLFCVCIGNAPFGLHMAVINDDQGFMGHNMGQAYLDAIDTHIIHQDNYTSKGYEAALLSVQKADTWGVISIGQNFSIDLLLRFQGGNLSDCVLEGSSIKLQLDSTNEQVAMVLLDRITDAFQVFARDTLKSLGYNPKLATLPIEMMQPVYGNLHATFMEFVAPGIIISLTFFLANGLTAVVFIMDKKLGMLDRCLASGMVSFEIMLAHMITQMLIVMVQVAVLLVFALIVFKVPCLGPLIWVILLVLIQGFLGMALGVLYSAICDDENSAIQLSLGSFFPLLLISGILWPLEAMPMWIRYIGYASPMTFACEAMRCILARGLDIAYFAVWRGYLVSAGWCVVIVILGGMILRMNE